MFNSIAQSYINPSDRAASTSSQNENTANELVDGDDLNDFIRLDIEFSISNFQIVRANDLIDKTFGHAAPQAAEMPTEYANVFKKHMRSISQGIPGGYPSEVGMYEPLIKAFKELIPPRPDVDSDDYTPKRSLRCVNVSQSKFDLQQRYNLNASAAPDLFLTFDPEEPRRRSVNFQYVPGITIEVKRKDTADLGFTAEETLSEGQKKEIMKLWEQCYRYVGIGQCGGLPYRFILAITITGKFMRIWRYSATGILITDRIDYCKDATVVWRLLQAIGTGPYSYLGLDVGRDCTFHTRYEENGWKDIRERMVDSYCDQAGKSTLLTKWKGKAKAFHSHLWLFKGPENIVPARLDPTPSSHPSTHTLDASPSSQTPAIVEDYIALSYPLHAATGIFGRSTRCYLVVKRKDLRFKTKNGYPVHVHPIEPKKLHMLKSSSQYLNRVSELSYFLKAVDRKKDVIKHLATPLAGGSILSSVQWNGRFYGFQDGNPVEVCPISPDPQHTRSSEELKEARKTLQDLVDKRDERIEDGREQRWILFEEVGTRLGNYQNVIELLGALCEAIEAYRDLLEDGKILHRDISESNVLINIATREGLLIDLDMAVDLNDRHIREPSQMFKGFPGLDLSSVSTEVVNVPRNDITGTLKFMSVALNNSPLHRAWHDMESFFWLLLFVCLRHVSGVSFRHSTTSKDAWLCNTLTSRRDALKTIFTDRVSRGGDYLDVLSQAKRIFLQSGHVKCEGNNPLNSLLHDLRELFQEFYQALSDAEALRESAFSLKEAYSVSGNFPIPADIYTLENKDDLISYRNLFQSASKAIISTYESNPMDDHALNARVLKKGIQKDGPFGILPTLPHVSDILDLFKTAHIQMQKLSKGHALSPAFDYIPPQRPVVLLDQHQKVSQTLSKSGQWLSGASGSNVLQHFDTSSSQSAERTERIKARASRPAFIPVSMISTSNNDRPRAPKRGRSVDNNSDASSYDAETPPSPGLPPTKLHRPVYGQSGSTHSQARGTSQSSKKQTKKPKRETEEH